MLYALLSIIYSLLITYYIYKRALLIWTNDWQNWSSRSNGNGFPFGIWSCKLSIYLYGLFPEVSIDGDYHHYYLSILLLILYLLILLRLLLRRNIKDSDIQALEKQLHLTLDKILSKKKRIIIEQRKKANTPDEVNIYMQSSDLSIYIHPSIHSSSLSNYSSS